MLSSGFRNILKRSRIAQDRFQQEKGLRNAFQDVRPSRAILDAGKGDCKMKMIHVHQNGSWLYFNPEMVTSIKSVPEDKEVILMVGFHQYILTDEDGTLADRLESDIETAWNGGGK